MLRPLGVTPPELGYVLCPDVHANGCVEKYSLVNLVKGLVADRALFGAYEGHWLRVHDHYVNGPAFGGLVGTAKAFGRFLQDQLRPRSVLFDDANGQRPED